MFFNFKDGKVIIDKVYYIEKLIQRLARNIKEGCDMSLEKAIGQVDENIPPLEHQKAKTFHTFMMKEMFFSKRSHQAFYHASCSLQ